MKSKKPRQYTIKGGVYVFNILRFNELLNEKKKKRKKEAIMREIADKTGDSFDAVKHWAKGDNSPKTVEKIYVCEEVLNQEKGALLLCVILSESNSKEKTAELETFTERSNLFSRMLKAIVVTTIPYITVASLWLNGFQTMLLLFFVAGMFCFIGHVGMVPVPQKYRRGFKIGNILFWTSYCFLYLACPIMSCVLSALA